MQPDEKQGETDLRYSFPSQPEAVREVLAAARAELASRGQVEDVLGTVEVVLAEALNNIVEHAYAERSDGEISVCLCINAGRLQARIEDHGVTMPNGVLPAGELTSLDVPTQDLPEGGFGWFLIRSMTEDLEYRREDDANILSFSMPLAPNA